MDLFTATTEERTSITLRDYQKKDLVAVQRAAEGHQRIMYQLPTGGGKTVWAVKYAIDHYKSSPHFPRVVVMSHRKEVQDQILQDFETFAPDIPLEVLSPMKLYNRTKKYDWPYTEHDLMIVDEAHHSPAKSWYTPIEIFPGTIIGLTATPWRLHRTEGFDHIWDYMHCGPDIVWLTDREHLAPLKVKTPPSREVLQGKGNNGGDFSMAETYKHLNQHEHINKHAIDWLLKHALPKQKKSIVFCLTIEHAHATASTLRSKGYPAQAIDAETPKTARDQIITDFKGGTLLSLCNVFIASEGFDVPTAEIIAMFRPTKSLAMYLQMAGRGTRPAPGKEHGIILDAAQNATIHGHPYEAHEWSLKARGYESTEETEAPSKRCDFCGEISPAGARKCYGCEEPFGKECEDCKTWRSWKWYPEVSGKCYDCKSNSAPAFAKADSAETNGATPKDPNPTQKMSNIEKEEHQTLLKAEFQLRKSGSYQRRYHHWLITIMRSRFSPGYGYVIISQKTGIKMQKWDYVSKVTALNGVRMRMFPDLMKKLIQKGASS